MTTSYTTTAPSVKAELPRAVLRTLNILLDLSKKHGFAWPTNDWLANRLGYTPRTITRHIAHLIAAGYLTAKRVANERHIRPTAAPRPQTAPQAVTLPPHAPAKPAKMSTRCLPATVEGKTKENNIAEPTPDQQNPLVSELCKHGVSEQIALRLASSKPEDCREQLDAIKTAQGIRDAAAWLVDAIRHTWKHKAKQKVAPTARVKRYAEKPPETSNDTETAWNALSNEEREQIRARVLGNLSIIARNRRHIVHAACLKYLQENSTPQADLEQQIFCAVRGDERLCATGTAYPPNGRPIPGNVSSG